MEQFGLIFDHFGLAVRDPATPFRFLESLGYKAGATCFDPLQKVNLAMRHHGTMPDVEVIWPTAGVPSPIDRILKHSESMIYHLCYRSSNVPATLLAIEAAGFDVLPITEPLPALLFDSLEVSFYSVLEFGLIEIIHSQDQR